MMVRLGCALIRSRDRCVDLAIDREGKFILPWITLASPRRPSTRGWCAAT
jgi:hypothetical protein